MNAWANIRTIAKREIGGYFASPVAYVFIVIFLLLCGFFTFMLGGFFERREASLVSFFLWHPWLYLFLVPAVAMRLWSEERRLGTMELLLTMPVTGWQAIVGKFIASWLFLALALALTFPVVISVGYLGSPDYGVIFCGYLGSLLLAGAYLAVGCMTSAMTRNQVISFMFHPVGGDLPVSDPGRLAARDRPARALGPRLAGQYGRRVQRGSAFRRFSKGRARFARRDFLLVDHRAFPVHDRRHYPQFAHRSLKSLQDKQ